MENLKRWIDEGLAKRGHGAKKALAAKLGRAPSMVSRLISSDEKVDITIRELISIAEFFGEEPPLHLLLPALGETKYRAQLMQLVTALSEEQAEVLIPVVRQVSKS